MEIFKVVVLALLFAVVLLFVSIFRIRNLRWKLLTLNLSLLAIFLVGLIIKFYFSKIGLVILLSLLLLYSISYIFFFRFKRTVEEFSLNRKKIKTLKLSNYIIMKYEITTPNLDNILTSIEENFIFFLVIKRAPLRIIFLFPEIFFLPITLNKIYKIKIMLTIFLLMLLVVGYKMFSLQKAAEECNLFLKHPRTRIFFLEMSSDLRSLLNDLEKFKFDNFLDIFKLLK
jgi:hypothetical protein